MYIIAIYQCSLDSRAGQSLWLSPGTCGGQNATKNCKIVSKTTNITFQLFSWHIVTHDYLKSVKYYVIPRKKELSIWLIQPQSKAARRMVYTSFVRKSCRATVFCLLHCNSGATYCSARIFFTGVDDFCLNKSLWRLRFESGPQL